MKQAYSFKILPGSANDASLLIRTALSLGLPGEKKRELTISEGDVINVITSMVMFHKGTKPEGTARRQYAPSDDDRHHMAEKRFINAGFEPDNLVVGEAEKIHVGKGNSGRGFTLPVFTIQGSAIIRNQEEAEKAIVYGIGPKRTFGFGFMHLTGSGL